MGSINLNEGASVAQMFAAHWPAIMAWFDRQPGDGILSSNNAKLHGMRGLMQLADFAASDPSNLLNEADKAVINL